MLNFSTMTTIRSRSFATHDGSFHADEVTACALLLLFQLIDKEAIVRTRDPLKWEQSAFVCDVGGLYLPEKGRFDHHQVEYRGSLSSAGMVLAYLRQQGHIGDEEYELLNRTLVQGVDAHDNGIDIAPAGVCTYSHIIANFVPVAHDASSQEQEVAFFQALDFALGHLQRFLERHRYTRSFRKSVEEAMAKGTTYLSFDSALPWMEAFFELGGEGHPALFVIMPSGEGWKLRGIPPNRHERMKVRCPLPQAWGGLMGEALQKITGIPGAIFCHKGRFFSLWKTREDALKGLAAILRS